MFMFTPTYKFVRTHQTMHLKMKTFHLKYSFLNSKKNVQSNKLLQSEKYDKLIFETLLFGLFLSSGRFKYKDWFLPFFHENHIYLTYWKNQYRKLHVWPIIMFFPLYENTCKQEHIKTSGKSDIFCENLLIFSFPYLPNSIPLIKREL